MNTLSLSPTSFLAILESIVEMYPQFEKETIQNLDHSPEEKKLFTLLFHLVETYLQSAKKLQLKGTYIGFMGPLGVGKTTLAAALTDTLGAQFIIKEPYLGNPFWKYSQTNREYMFRSQVYFLLNNIQSDIEAISHEGIVISDTSTLTDIVMWAEWYHEIGRLTKQEYELYTKLVNLLKPIIPRPSLLITLIPDSAEDLYQGIRQRQSVEEGRIGELVFTVEDLIAQIKRVKNSSRKINKEWKTSILTLIINPRTIYTDKKSQTTYIQQIDTHLSLPDKE